MPSVGIVGGSGFYELLEGASEHRVDTPFGAPSDAVVTGTFGGREVAFLPRHGRGHRIPPHRINHRANIWALHELGVERLLLPCAVGSLKPELEPGVFVVVDQFVDRTSGRMLTFYDGDDPPDHDRTGPVTHVSMAEPYCPELRAAAVAALDEMGRAYQDGGTLVVIQGPRFSTRAESQWYSAAGWDVVGMTQVPEAPLARELAMCVTGVAMVTDHDAGLEGHPDVTPVTNQEVIEVFAANVTHVKDLVGRIVAGLANDRTCDCGTALEGASFG